MTELVKVYSDTRPALESLDAFGLVLQTVQEALISSQRKYDKGAADIIEMLSSQKELAGFKQERGRAVSDWRSARLRLMTAAGQLGRTQLEVSALTLGEYNSLSKSLSRP